MIVHVETLEELFEELEHVATIADQVLRCRRETTEINELSQHVGIRVTALVEDEQSGAFVVEFGEVVGRDVGSNDAGSRRYNQLRKLVEEFCERKKLQLRGGRWEL